MFNLLISADGFDPTQVIIMIVLVLLIGAMIVMPMFNNKKNQKATNDLYGGLKVGDKIMTIGGIIGNILEIREVSPVDKELLIETGSEGSKTTMLISIKALYQNLTQIEAQAAEAKARAEALARAQAEAAEEKAAEEKAEEKAAEEKVEEKATEEKVEEKAAEADAKEESDKE